MTTLGGNVSPAPPATSGEATLRQVGVIHLSQPGLLVRCRPVIVHCPPGYRVLYPRLRSGGRPPELVPYRLDCVARFPLRTLPPEPLRTAAPYRTPPLRTQPPQPAGS
jgi:hypothetical protein